MKAIINSQGMINIGKIEITKTIGTTTTTEITRIATMIETRTSHKPKSTSKRSQLKKKQRNNRKKIEITTIQICYLMIVIIDLLCHVNVPFIHITAIVLW